MSINLPFAESVTQRRPSSSEVDCVLQLVAPDHPDRSGLEAFIACEFARGYGARLQHFCHTLAGCRDARGEWVAALGYTLANDSRLFLEQYLACPIEAAIGAHVGYPVSRSGIVEVGNMAGSDIGAARALIVAMTRHLHGQRLLWVAFTATRGLLNSFSRLRLVPSVLAEADPACLGKDANEWGSYYATRPQVMFGNIGFGHERLAR